MKAFPKKKLPCVDSFVVVGLHAELTRDVTTCVHTILHVVFILDAV